MKDPLPKLLVSGLSPPPSIDELMDYYDKALKEAAERVKQSREGMRPSKSITRQPEDNEAERWHG